MARSLADLPAATDDEVAPENARGGWWPKLRRALLLAFVALVLFVLVKQAREIDWPAVAQALRGYRWPSLLGAGALALASYAVYSAYDLIARHQSGHQLGSAAVLGTAFVSYCGNLNFGPWLGGIGLRLRLYTRLGLDAATVAEIYAFSVLTNWLGYAAVAGAALLWQPLVLPAHWYLGPAALRVAGAVLLVLAALYVGACFTSSRREWRVRSHKLNLPTGAVALTQLALAATNWSLIAAVVFVLLPGKVDYFSVLSVLLAAAVAGAIAHIPAGLGVIETVFIALLGDRLGSVEIIGALLVYRVIYYLLPLLPAALIYMRLSSRASSPS